MNEHTTYLRSARRHPRALFGQVQIYAQNNPRAYAVRAVLILLLLLPPAVLFVGRPEDWPQMLLFLRVAAVPVVVVGAVIILLMPWSVRRMLGGSVLPPDTDPVDLLEAKRQLRRGGLHERQEVNRAARLVAAQAEAKINSPQAITVVSLFGLLGFAFITTVTYLAVGPGADFWLAVSLTLLFLVYMLFLRSWVKRYRQRARDFAEAYDARRDEAEQEGHPQES
ncbi:hypothetical protein [Nocardiopsis valliformis]|uniref:hypothetical protein n=1 Tax=Nocardiopsis valliformis TaxID=239974 RepID=UPI00034CEB4D|nr:hypothetical protein [Nocardiopsis valliformis]